MRYTVTLTEANALRAIRDMDLRVVKLWGEVVIESATEACFDIEAAQDTHAAKEQVAHKQEPKAPPDAAAGAAVGRTSEGVPQAPPGPDGASVHAEAPQPTPAGLKGLEYIDPEWVKRMAEKEAGCIVSAGGLVAEFSCRRCKGSGREGVTYSTLPGGPTPSPEACRDCNGSGMKS